MSLVFPGVEVFVVTERQYFGVRVKLCGNEMKKKTQLLNLFLEIKKQVNQLVERQFLPLTGKTKRVFRFVALSPSVTFSRPVSNLGPCPLAQRAS